MSLIPRRFVSECSSEYSPPSLFPMQPSSECCRYMLVPRYSPEPVLSVPAVRVFLSLPPRRACISNSCLPCSCLLYVAKQSALRACLLLEARSRRRWLGGYHGGRLTWFTGVATIVASYKRNSATKMLKMRHGKQKYTTKMLKTQHGKQSSTTKMLKTWHGKLCHRDVENMAWKTLPRC